MTEPIHETVYYWKSRCEALDDSVDEQRMLIADLAGLLGRMYYATDPAKNRHRIT